MSNTKLTLKFTFANHAEMKNRILFAFDDTGIDLDNPEHKHYAEIVCRVMAAQLFAKAHGIDPENVKF